MEIIIQSKYIKPGENIHNGDIVKIKDEGKYNQGKYGPQLEFNLELPNGEIKTYTPNTQTQINLKQEFGGDSKLWINQPLKAWVFEVPKRGDMKMQLILTPESWEKPIKKAAGNAAAAEVFGKEDQGEVDVKNIPF